MKQTKQRIVAIDYFRGVCILMVLLNHSWMFSMPFAYLAGAGGLWTSAAELFFLLSGITLMIVRGGTIKSQFAQTSKKLWRRAGIFYMLCILLTSLSLCLLYILPRGVSSITIGPLPASQGLHLLGQILSFQYSVGLAGFLMYYCVFLIFSPLILYAVLSRAWPAVLALSIFLFAASSVSVIHSYPLQDFGIWQLYFIMGIFIGKIRLPFLGWFYSLPKKTIDIVTAAAVATTAAAVAISALLAFNLYPAVNRLATDGWLPTKVRGAYFHLLNHEVFINNLLRDNRMGLLRPLFSLLFLGTLYLIYQKYKPVILRRTQSFVTAMGRETLYIFAAQALLIPVIAALPISHGSILNNLALTSSFIYLMWLITKRNQLKTGLINYAASLSNAFSEAKYSAMYGQEDQS